MNGLSVVGLVLVIVNYFELKIKENH